MDAAGAAGRYVCAAGTRSMREVVALLREAGYAGHRLPRLALDGALGDRVVSVGSHFQPRGVGQYLRTHLGRGAVDSTIGRTEARLWPGAEVPRGLRTQRVGKGPSRNLGGPIVSTVADAGRRESERRGSVAVLLSEGDEARREGRWGVGAP